MTIIAPAPTNANGTTCQHWCRTHDTEFGSCPDTKSKPIAAKDLVTWTSKRNGATHTGTVEAIETWTGRPRARVDTDTTGAHKVTTVVDVAGLARITTPRIPAQRTTGGAA